MQRRWAATGFLFLCFLANQVWQRVGSAPVFFRSYADDLLAVPLILGCFHLLLIYVYHRRAQDRLPWIYIVLTVAALGFHFEVLLPHFSRAYTADVLDVLMYMAGAGFYALFLNGGWIRKHRFFPSGRQVC